MFSRLHAVGFVSHDISLSGTLCLPPLQTRIGVSEHSTGIGRVEAVFGDRDTLCDAAGAIIANALERKREV
jgi:hypothetical protein